MPKCKCKSFTPRLSAEKRAAGEHGHLSAIFVTGGCTIASHVHTCDVWSLKVTASLEDDRDLIASSLDVLSRAVHSEMYACFGFRIATRQTFGVVLWWDAGRYMETHSA